MAAGTDIGGVFVTLWGTTVKKACATHVRMDEPSITQTHGGCNKKPLSLWGASDSPRPAPRVAGRANFARSLRS